MRRFGVCLVVLTMLTVSACGSSQTNDPSNAPSPSGLTDDFTPGTYYASTSTAEDFAADRAEAVSFVDENRVKIELMVSLAEGVRADLKDNRIDEDCTDLQLAAEDVSAGAPLENRDTLMVELLTATSRFQTASAACDYDGQEQSVRSDVTSGLTSIRTAERRAKVLGTRL